MEEIWKDIAGYENYYQVSTLGRVKSLRRLSNSGLILKEKIMRPCKDKYPRLLLSRFSKKKTITVHIYVARAFLPNPENKPYVNHIDGNKQNNCISNLEWCTAKENTRHYRTKLRGNKLHNTCKLDINDVAMIRMMFHDGFSCKAVYDRYPNMSHEAIQSIKHNRNWKWIDIETLLHFRNFKTAPC